MAEVTLIPKHGTMTAEVFENPHVGISPTLFFKIEIPLKPFKFEGKTQKTSVRLGFINFGVADWRKLSDREFAFPKNPEKGYIDGSLYLAGVHAPADATGIRFGRLRGNTWPATLDIEFDFTYEGPSKLGKIGVTWQIELGVDPPGLDRTFEEASRFIKRWER